MRSLMLQPAMAHQHSQMLRMMPNVWLPFLGFKLTNARFRGIRGHWSFDSQTTLECAQFLTIGMCGSSLAPNAFDKTNLTNPDLTGICNLQDMGGADVTGAKICSAFEPTLQNYVGQPVWMNCASIPGCPGQDRRCSAE